ncbi:MAG: TldD/PmbA family protein [Desulfomonilia bacterium]|jgi:PmbA protein|uniref:Peptidase PmbA n=1 Tax=anaerobic digester metagenome TaxID=1263854 RepID=A0A485LZX9_9ZZZZ|nr:TldD/PmbA family protein [Pseudomonadota bacterium]HON38384.1 TldD/PmbA family protein [Deltaproteobacteria bacterium]HRS56421.1 TldD/PmbA family protein [Desulfomonilia bacterium]HPD21575.1 TldD/PmbA family protein [Deltaproteobacteria bacterium]HPX17233.1 TldD/PmbA family protein [Deltaproteobacteria bacterium]
MDLETKIEKTYDLLKKRSIDDFEIYGTDSDTIRAESKEGSMGSLSKSRESGVGVRLIIDGAMGFAYGAEPTDELVDAAITSARYQFKDQNNHLPPRQEGYEEIDILDPAVGLLAAEDCIARAISLERSSREADSRIHQVRKASFSRTVSRVSIMNSHGIDASTRMSVASASIMVVAKQGDDSQSGYEFDFSHHLDNINVEKVGRQAAFRATEMLQARKMQTTKIPVLFDNTTTAQMLDFISDAFVGENVIKGKSFIADKKGQKYFSDMVRLTDNPLDKRAADASPFDGEGVRSRETVLVDNGTILAFVYDSYWGRVAGESSTGSSLRGGYRAMPTSGVRHLCMEPGREDMKQNLKGLKRVLKITDIMGMHTANPITGEFSVGVSGLFMEEGDPLYPVREAAISGNIYELFSRVMAVGTDVREFGGVLCPSVLIDAIDVSAQ